VEHADPARRGIGPDPLRPVSEKSGRGAQHPGRPAESAEAGLLEKRSYCERPPRDEYLITEAGRDFLPVLHALGAWASRHHGSGALSYAVDRETGAVVEPVVIDRATGRAIGSLALRIVTPGGA
jgi:hypothetical protein